jgi:DNA-binding transcriptional LysR family regulator
LGQFEDMQVFVRVVEAGGISPAAEQLGIAKSAVSRRISELEKRLGSTLINRTTRRSNLTDIGQQFYERALRLIDDVAELNSLASDANERLSGAINLAVPLSFGLCHLTPAINAFLDLHPDITININFSDRHLDLVEEGLDLAFRIAELEDSSMMARKICPIKRSLCASPAYLESAGSPATIQELKQHDLLHYSGSGSKTWSLLDKKGKLHKLKISSKLVANNGDFLVDMAIAGRGIIAMPTFISWQALAKGELVPVLKDYSLPQLNAYAIYPQTRYLSVRSRTLIDFLVERFGDTPYWDV